MKPHHLVIVGLALSIVSSVWAQAEPGREGAEDQTREEARTEFERGLELVAVEDYPGALAAFEKAYGLFPTAGSLFNIGICHKALFQYVEADETCEKFLAETDEESHGEMTEQASAAREEMKKLVAAITLEGAPGGAEVRIGGKLVGTTPLKSSLAVNPGSHVIGMSREGFEPFELELTVTSGREVVVAVVMKQLEQDEPVDEYAAIMAEAEKAKKAHVERTAKLEEEWARVKQIVSDPTIDRAQRIAVLEHFLRSYPEDNPHEGPARGWKGALEEGDEPEDYLTPEYLQTKTEWFHLRLGGGNYGGTAMISAFTLRWRHFYWETLRVAGGGGVLAGDGDDEERRWMMSGGTGAGIPWHIEDTGRFEIRFGLGVMIGRIEDAEGGDDMIGLILVPEGYLVWHVFEYLALQAGIDVRLATFDFTGEYTFSTPALGGFIGFRI